MYIDQSNNVTSDIQNARSWTQKEKDAYEEKLEELADDFMETPNAIHKLMYEHGDDEVTDGILKAMVNANIYGQSESMVIFAKAFCQEIQNRLREKCEKDMK